MGTGSQVDQWVDEVLDKLGLDTEEERAIVKQVLSLLITLGMINAGGDMEKVCKVILQVNQGTGYLLGLMCPGYKE